MINTNSQYYIDICLICLTITLLSDFCVFTIRRSFGRLQVLHALVSGTTLYCALYTFLTLF